MTDDLLAENNAITLAMDMGQVRPDWDARVLKAVGFATVQTDTTLGHRVLGSLDLASAPMFGIFAQK